MGKTSGFDHIKIRQLPHLLLYAEMYDLGD